MEENTLISRKKINKKLSNILKGEDFLKIIETVPDLKIEYDIAHREEYQKQLEAFLSEERIDEETKKLIKNSETDFKFTLDEDTHRFKELYTIFLEKKKEQKKILAKKEEDNFNAKSKIIEDLKELTEKEFNNFGEMFAKFKDLQTNWKKIGDVNKARFQTLQTEYSHLMDKFFYNVNIHKDLQEYSFEKNKIQKEKIIEKLKELTKADSIIQLEHYIKKYQKEWDEIGPTFQKDWENIKDEYWNTINDIYAKIRKHYQVIREKQKDSILKKETLIEELKTKIEEVKESKSPKEWTEISNKVKELQQAWKKTGFSKKAKDDELWGVFRELSNQFFDYVKELYDKLNIKRDGFEEKKLQLIKKAKELKNSKEWRETTNKFLKLQEDWKKIGSLKPQKEHKLWNKFRGNCDEFFTTKKEFFSTLDERQEENLKQKNTIAKEIEESENKEKFTEKVLAWWAMGHVPKKEIRKVNEDFKKAIAANKNLALDDAEIEKIVFDAKIKAFKNSDNSESLLKNEFRFVKEKIENLKTEIAQYENNLSFFGQSKGAQKLKEVVEKRVDGAKNQLSNWQEKIKLFR